MAEEHDASSTEYRSYHSSTSRSAPSFLSIQGKIADGGYPPGEYYLAADAVGSAPQEQRQHSREAVQNAIGQMEAAAGRALDNVAPMVQGPLLIKEASLRAQCTDVEAAAADLTRQVESLGGYEQSSNLFVYETEHWGHQGTSTTAHQAHLTLRVPVAHFDQCVASLKASLVGRGGRIMDQSASARDVTSEYVDVVARQRSDEAALAQTELLMAAAATIREVLEVKREMDAISQRLETAKAQRKSLETSASMSTISVQLEVIPSASSSPSPSPGWSPLDSGRRAMTSLVRATQTVVDLLIYMAVFAVPVSALVGLVVWIVIFTRRQRGLIGM